jgi:hypothetical protein
LWLDFSDNSTLTFSSGNFIEEIADKSGENNDVSKTTVSEQAERIIGAQNGLDVAQFDGVNDGYEIPSAASGTVTGGSDYTMFTVSKQNANANATVLAADRTANNNYHVGITYNNGSNELKFYTQDNTNIEGGLPSRSTLASLALIRNGVDANAWIAGAKETLNQGGATSTKNLFIGKSANGDEPLNGQICEVLIYNRALSDAEVDLILDYLNNKWGSI